MTDTPTPMDENDPPMCRHGTRESEGWCAQCVAFGDDPQPANPVDTTPPDAREPGWYWVRKPYWHPDDMDCAQWDGTRWLYNGKPDHEVMRMPIGPRILTPAEREALIAALEDAVSALRYIRQHYHDERTASGGLYGVDFDRVEEKAKTALAEKPPASVATTSAAEVPHE